MTEIKISITKEDLVAIAKAKAKTAGIDIDALTLRQVGGLGTGPGLQVKPEWYAIDDSDDEFTIPWFDIDAVSVTFRPKEVDPC